MADELQGRQWFVESRPAEAVPARHWARFSTHPYYADRMTLTAWRWILEQAEQAGVPPHATLTVAGDALIAEWAGQKGDG